jgi:hypothetical protein
MQENLLPAADSSGQNGLVARSRHSMWYPSALSRSSAAAIAASAEFESESNK